MQISLPNNSFIGAQTILIDKLGRTGANFLNQILYWTNNSKCKGKKHDGKKWVYNVEKEWGNQIRLSERQVRRHVSKFVEMGLIKVAKLGNKITDRTNYYSPNFDRIEEIMGNKNIPEAVSEASIETSSPATPTNLPSGHDVLISLHRLPKDINNIIILGTEKEEFLTGFENDRITEEQRDIIESIGVQKKPDPERPNATKMLEIWNADPEHRKWEGMNSNLVLRLLAVLGTKFDNSLEKWQDYCDDMSSKWTPQFLPQLRWALKDDVIDGYKAQIPLIRKSLSHEISIKSAVEHNLDKLNEDEEILAVRKKLIERVGHAEYISWFEQAKFVKRNGRIDMVAPNSFVETKWDERYSDVMKFMFWH